MTAKAIRAAGISWYRAEDYGRILEIMEDADKLPATFDQWLKTAERGERELKDKGQVRGKPFSPGAIAAALKLLEPSASVHGMRSSFRGLVWHGRKRFGFGPHRCRGSICRA
jgi:hypothetical protein